MTVAANRIFPIREHVFPTLAELCDALRQRIADVSEEAIRARGEFSIVLTGGRTAKYLYRQLRDLDTSWASWRIFWGDERCLPPDHPERNSRQAYDEWLDHVAIPAENVFPIPVENGVGAAAERYSRLLEGVKTFDLVLLSLGDDGHVASVFPGAFTPETYAVIPVENAPKPPAQRVTLSLARLSQTSELAMLVVGTGKQAALKAYRRGGSSPASDLRQLVSMDIWIDSAAAGKAPPGFRLE